MKLGRVRIQPGFLLLCAWLNYTDRQGIFRYGMLCCAVHELGHLAALAYFRVAVKEIRLTAFGANIQIAGCLSYGQEIIAALAGPAINIIMALICCRIPGGELLAGLSLVLGLFNLLPFGQMDGGRCVRCLACQLAGPEMGHRAAGVLSYAMGLAAAAGGMLLWIMGGNLTMLIMSVWVVFGIAKKEEIS